MYLTSGMLSGLRAKQFLLSNFKRCLLKGVTTNTNLIIFVEPNWDQIHDLLYSSGVR